MGGSVGKSFERSLGETYRIVRGKKIVLCPASAV